jgi:CRP-like cAMP-binding protein
MMLSKDDLIEFLSHRPMFVGLNEEDLSRIADRLEEFTLEADKPVFTQGERGTVFYIIYTGKVRLWHTEQKEEVELGMLESGDGFGEEAMLYSRPRPYSVATMEETTLLSLHKPQFNWMLTRFPQVRKYLETIAETLKQARRKHFDWLQRGEMVHLMIRRHPAELIIDLFKPAIALLVAGVFFFFSTLMGPVDSLRYLAYGIGYPLIGLSILWAIWEVIDWRNDYFFVTNQRVVWLEQVVLQSASRQEAPLAAIQSVDVSTNQIGRIFGFGDVHVRTFTGTGSLTLTGLDDPKRFKSEIEDLLIRVRHKQESTADERVRQSIRQTLGLESAEVEDPVLHVVEPEEAPRRGLLKTREVKGDTITYHKHWWVLLAKTWIWLLALFGTVVFVTTLVFYGFVLFNFRFPTTSTLFFATLAFFIFLGILAYHFLDWKNDIYQLTSEMVIDSEKKPFGQEISKSAPIKNIISLEHQRNGILRLILNFGIVKVVVADEILTFFDVGNPALIQQDIYYRQEQLKLQEEEAEMEKDRAHITKWLQAYHEVLQSENEPSSEESQNID